MTAVVTKIMHVFVDALPHVPEHRRLPILAQLVTTLGPARFLWIQMVLLFKLHATQSSGSASEKVATAGVCGELVCLVLCLLHVLQVLFVFCEQDAALERDVDFWISLCCQFNVSDQLTSLINIHNFLLQLPDDKDDGEGENGFE